MIQPNNGSIVTRGKEQILPPEELTEALWRNWAFELDLLRAEQKQKGKVSSSKISFRALKAMLYGSSYKIVLGLLFFSKTYSALTIREKFKI